MSDGEDKALEEFIDSFDKTLEEAVGSPEYPNEDALEHDVEIDQDDSDEVSDDPDGEADDVEDQPDPLSERQELFDKELQKVQQLRSVLSKQLEAAKDDPSEKNLEAAKKTKGRLDKILEQGEEADPYNTQVQLAQEVLDAKGDFEKFKGDADVSQKAMKETVQSLQTQLAAMQFKAENPELAGEYESLSKQAADAANLIDDPNDPLSDRAWGVIAGNEFTRLVEARKAELLKKDDPASDTAKIPKSVNPVKKRSANTRKASPTLAQKEAEFIKNLNF